MKKIFALCLLVLLCSTSTLAKITNQPSSDDVMTDIPYSEASVAAAVRQIREECVLLADNEEIEQEYLAGFIEICVIDNVAISLAIDQGKTITVEPHATEYLEGAMALDPVLELSE